MNTSATPQNIRVTVCVALLTCASPAALGQQSATPPAAIEEVVVTATRTEKPLMEVPAAITLQSTEDLRQKGFNYGTDEFRGVPGVFFRRGEGDGEEFPFISIRGVTGNHGNDTFLALLDGVPFVGPDEEVMLFEVPYAAVDSIEIVRGPVSALYGRGAIAGAVNYRSRPIEEDTSEILISKGSEDFSRASAHLERSFASGAGLMLNATMEDFGGWRDNSQRDLSTFFVKGVIPVGERGELSGWIANSDRESEVPSAIPTLADGTVLDVFGGDTSFLGYHPTWNKSEGLMTSGRFRYQLSDSMNLTLTAQNRRFDSDVRLNFYDYFEFNPGKATMGVNGFASANESEVFFAEAVLDWTVGRHTIVAGVNSERATLDEREFWSGENDPFFSGACGFRFYSIQINYLTGKVLNDAPSNACFMRDELRSESDTTNTFQGAFIQDEFALTDRLTATAGLRYDAFDREIDFSVVGGTPVSLQPSGDADALSPKFSLSYDYGAGIAYASYGKGFNSNFGPTWQWDPVTYLRDEKATTIDSYEVGAKGRALNDRLEWETSLFQLEQKDRRIFVPNPDPTGPREYATTGQKYSSRGFESALRFNVSARTKATITYTYLDPEWDELLLAGSFGAPDLDFSGVTPQGVPEHMFYAELNHQFSDWLTVGATYESYGDYFVDLSNSVSAGAYELLGANASIRVPGVEQLSMDLSITNLLNEDYYFLFASSRTQVTNASPGVPRMARATVRWKF